MALYDCGGCDHRMSRRRMLGLAGGAGLGALLHPSAARALAAKDRQVLFIWLDGGMSQLESWDPKPRTEFGGPFGSIPTSVPGVHVSELMPCTAKVVDRLAIVRSMCTKDENHSTGVPRVQRGDPIDRGVDYPFLGAALAKFMGPGTSGLPPYLWIKPGSGGFIASEAGFLGPAYGALALGDGRLPALIHAPAEIPEQRRQDRDALRRAADARFRARRLGSEVETYEGSFDGAQRLMRRKELFDASKVAEKDVRRYGDHALGRHLLQARRLLEAGVRVIKVTSYHWDTHADNFNTHRQLVPQIDRPFAALIEDLDERGMLDHVLVVLMSEFGRTPKINNQFGRDHWPEAWSLALAGCGVRRGVVAGRTTPDGAWVDERPYDVGHLFHTVFRAVGIDPDEARFEHNGQRLAIAREDAKAIKEVLA